MIQFFMRAKWRWQVLRGSRLRRFQARRAERMVRFAYQHAPFYRNHWELPDAATAARQWQNLPPVDKRLMMANFDRFNTRGISREAALATALQAEQSRDFAPTIDGLTVGLSSGTSGHRGVFMVSAAEQAAWAGTILARTIHQWRGYRVAFFLRSNSNLYEQVGSRVIEFRYFDLMLPVAQAIAALNAFAPEIVVGPPSLLGLLAEAQQAGGLRIRPARLISVAEVLEPQDQRRLKQVFGATVEQIYQCTEGLLAISCERGALHVQEDLVALHYEPLPASDGLRVTPLVTDLWRTTQPIIRYRLNDVLQLDPGPCACGSPWQVIESIEGRCDDLCYFEDQAGGLRPFFPDTLRRMILLASAAISDYQVFQERPGHVRVHLALPMPDDWPAVSAAVRQSIAQTVAQYSCRPAQIEVLPGLVTQALGAKRRRVQRLG